MVFEREIRAVQLKQKALRDDGFVFDLQRAADRGEIGVLGVVIFVAEGVTATVGVIFAGAVTVTVADPVPLLYVVELVVSGV